MNNTYVYVLSRSSACVVRLASLASLMVFAGAAGAQRQVPAPYVPGPTWERRNPDQVGMDAAKLQEAIAFAKERESKAPRDLEEAHYQTFGREPFGGAVGAFKPRGEPSGIIVRNGYIVAEWGEPARVDMTFSVTKSFVSTVVGLAVDRGMIRSADDTVSQYMGPVLHAAPPALGPEGGKGRFDARTTIALFDTPHNRKITWRNLLQRRAIGRGRCGGSRSGRIVRATRRRPGGHATASRQERSTNTTTRA